MTPFSQLFGRARSVIIGMIHLRALPGSPKYQNNMQEIIDVACSEAEAYKKANFDALLIENTLDIPWCLPSTMGPETTAAMSVVCNAIRSNHPSIPMGIQVLAAANREAMAIAHAADLNFIRAEGFVFGHMGDEGPINSCAADLVRYRKNLGADNVMIFTDIKKKHCSHAITSDVSLSETAHAAELFMSDGLIVTGISTGATTDPTQVEDVQKSVDIPVLVGSGVTTDNIQDYMSASGIIIGSHLKTHGHFSNDLDPTKVSYFMDKVNKLRRQEKEKSEQETSEDFSSIEAQGG